MQPFQVYARIRPLNQRQRQFTSGKGELQALSQATIQVGDNLFQLDHVFTPGIANEQFFSGVVQPLADQFLAGINTTIFAYGITGAGKSHTMFGNSTESGIIQLSLQYLCSQVREMSSTTLTISYLQIYNEQVFDLLRPNSENLQILDDPALGVIVPDLQQRKVDSADIALTLIQQGNLRRVVAETKANECSSRSHAIVQLGIQRETNEGVFVSKMSLVDLAGSEKQNVYSDVKGLRNLQGSNINRSLLTLGNCITILSERGRKGGFVPYRDSKLTRLLKDSLGGNTRTAMIACISPSPLSQEETINTLKYATRARKIQKFIKQNILDRRPVQELKRQILRLRQQLEERQSMKALPPKQLIQKKITELISNVETLTLLKNQKSNDFSDNIRELQLNEQQRRLVESIIGVCCEDVSSNKMRRCNTGEIRLKPQFNKKHNLVNDVKQEYKENMRQIGIENHQTVQSHADYMKNVSFSRGNLQNRRLHYQKQRKNLRDMINAYMVISNELDRCEIMNRANEILAKQKEIYSCFDIRILQKISRGEQLNEVDQGDNEISRPLEYQIVNNIGGKKHRFIQSLEQLQKMKRKISSANEEGKNGENLFV